VSKVGEMRRRSTGASYTQEELSAIRSQSALDATEDEIQILLLLARKYGLDPLTREIWYSGSHYYTTSPAFWKVAEQQPDFDGVYSFLVRSGDRFEIDLTEGRVIHRFGARRGALTGAWAVCYHKLRRPAVSYVDSTQAVQTDISADQLAHRLQMLSEMSAVRKHFPLRELYTTEEQSADMRV